MLLFWFVALSSLFSSSELSELGRLVSEMSSWWLLVVMWSPVVGRGLMSLSTSVGCGDPGGEGASVEKLPSLSWSEGGVGDGDLVCSLLRSTVVAGLLGGDSVLRLVMDFAQSSMIFQFVAVMLSVLPRPEVEAVAMFDLHVGLCVVTGMV